MHKNSNVYSKIKDKSQHNNTSSMVVMDTTKLFTYRHRVERLYVQITVGVKTV